jgi:hypothetical protein
MPPQPQLRAKRGLIEETAKAVAVVTQTGGGTVQGVGTGTINNAKDTFGLLRDAGGKLINLATFGTTNKAEAARTDGRIDGAIALGEAAVTDPLGTARALGESFVKPFAEGSDKLKAGDTFGGTAQITEAASDTILNAATGGGKAVLGVILKGGKLPNLPDVTPGNSNLGDLKGGDPFEPPVLDIPSGLNFSDIQLQKKYKHAEDFGLPKNFNSQNAKAFQNAINNHIGSGKTVKIEGTYRGDPVTHYLDPTTGLNVISDKSGNFISGFKLNPAQLQNVKKRGSL